MDVLAEVAAVRIEAGLSQREAANCRSDSANQLLLGLMAQRGLAAWAPEKGPYGNPLPRHGWYVSKSHCSEYVAAALGREPLGIDVEPIRWSRVADWERVLDEAERKLLGNVDELAFTRLWTAKEAVLKADGIGIGGLSRCRLVSVLRPDCLELRHAGRNLRVWQQIQDNHVVSVCSYGQETVSWRAAP